MVESRFSLQNPVFHQSDTMSLWFRNSCPQNEGMKLTAIASPHFEDLLARGLSKPHFEVLMPIFPFNASKWGLDGQMSCKAQSNRQNVGKVIALFTEWSKWSLGDFGSYRYTLSLKGIRTEPFTVRTKCPLGYKTADIAVQKTKKKPRRAFLPFVRNSIHKEFLEKSRKIW